MRLEHQNPVSLSTCPSLAYGHRTHRSMQSADGTHYDINFKPSFVGNGRILITQGRFPHRQLREITHRKINDCLEQPQFLQRIIWSPAYFGEPKPFCPTQSHSGAVGHLTFIVHLPPWVDDNSLQSDLIILLVPWRSKKCNFPGIFTTGCVGRCHANNLLT